MGSTGIIGAVAGPNIAAAFRELVDNDRREYGTDYYSGSFNCFSNAVNANTGIYPTRAAAETAAYNALNAESWSQETNYTAMGFPYTMDTRDVEVSVAKNAATDTIARTMLSQGAADQGLLGRDETVQSVRVSMYGGGTPARVIGTVTILKANAQTVRTVIVTVTVAGQPDNETAAVLKAVTAKVKLRAGETITGVYAPTLGGNSRGTQDPIAAPVRDVKVVSEASKGKPVTRYVVLGSQSHNDWATGFVSQADARAWITDTLTTTNYSSFGTPRTYDIVAMTRRETGEALVTVRQQLKKTVWQVEVSITHTPPDRAATVDGWVFAGYAKL